MARRYNFEEFRKILTPVTGFNSASINNECFRLLGKTMLVHGRYGINITDSNILDLIPLDYPVVIDIKATLKKVEKFNPEMKNIFVNIL